MVLLGVKDAVPGLTLPSCDTVSGFARLQGSGGSTSYPKRMSQRMRLSLICADVFKRLVTLPF